MPAPSGWMQPLPSRAALEQATQEAWDRGEHVVVMGDLGSGRTTFAVRRIAAAPGQRNLRLSGARELADVPFAALAALTAQARSADKQNLPPAALIASLANAGPSGSTSTLLLDNAEWVDTASAAVFAQAAAHGTLRLMLVTTALSRLPTPLRSFAIRAHQVRLGAITHEDALELVEEVLGQRVTIADADRLARLAGFNPLHLHELTLDAADAGAFEGRGAYLRLRDGWRPRGQRIAELVALRLAHQEAPVREAVEVVAVAGTLPWDLAARLMDAQVLDRACDAGLLAAERSLMPSDPAPGEVTVQLSGALTAQAVLAQLTDQRLRAYTALVRSALTHGRASSLVHITVSLHAMYVGLPTDPAEVEADVLAAVQARQFAAAVALTDLMPPAEMSEDVLLARSRALFETNRVDEAAALIGPLVAAGSVPARIWAARMSAAFDRTDEAADLLAPRATDSPRWAATLAAHRDVVRARAGRPIGMDRLRRHSANELLDGELRAAALHLAQITDVFAGHGRDVVGQFTALVKSEQWGAFGPTGRGDLTHTLFSAATAAGCPPQEIAAIGDGIDWEELEIPYVRFIASQGVSHVESGNAGEAIRMLLQALALLRDGDPYGLARPIAASAATATAMLGDQRATAELLAYATGSRVGNSGFMEIDTTRLLLGPTLMVCGRDAAMTLWRDLRERSETRGENYQLMRVLHDGWRLGLNDDLDAIATVAGRVQGRYASTLALYPAAIAGDATAYAHVSACHDELEQHLFGAELTTAAARAAHERGQGKLSAHLLASAAATLAPLGPVDTPILGRVRLDPMKLSGREYDICRRAMAGLNNAAIAEELFLSSRTVEGHLQRAYRKLGVSDRRQLAPQPAENLVTT